MFQWLKRFKRQREVVYFPEVTRIKAVRPSEEDALLVEMADGYEKHEAVFRLVMLYLRRKEGEITEVPSFKNPDEMFAWQEKTKRAAIEANLLRFIVRFPFEGQRIKKRMEQGDKNTQDDAGLYVD